MFEKVQSFTHLVPEGMIVVIVTTKFIPKEGDGPKLPVGWLKNLEMKEAREVVGQTAAEDVVVALKGWRLRFIPSQGEFCGKEISRVFVTGQEAMGPAAVSCRRRYGEDTVIIAGQALHSDQEFMMLGGRPE